MTFLHKLAKRLALIPTVAVLAAQLLASCSQGTSQDYLGPDPSKPNPTGSYIGLSVTPDDPQLIQGDSIRLQARGWLSSGLSSLASVSWSAAGGTVSSDGWYRATSPGSFRVRAISTANSSISDSVLIVVIPPGGIARLDVTPSAASLAAGTRQQFTAVVLMGDGTLMYPTVSWSATGGTISATGLFTAPATEGEYTVTASTIDGALVGRSTGMVGPAVLTSFSVSPDAVIMESGESSQFTVSASSSNGSTAVPALTWTATGGTVTPSGVYTAGVIPGSHRVIASSAGKADTANVTILPRVIGMRLSPLTALLAVEASQQVTAYAIRNDGSEVAVVAQWSAQGGTISPSGNYLAGNVPGTYAIAGTLTTQDGRVFSDTAHFVVGADEAAAIQLYVTPDTAKVTGGTKVQFVAAASLTGGSTVPAVTWTATGGTIDQQGLFTAGGSTGNFRVIGKRKQGNKADTATVVIQPAPAPTVPTVTGFTIAPQTAILAIEESRQFSASLSWSDGQVHPADISWVSAGGTITQNGLYRAGTVAGAYLVIATCGCGKADTASITIPAATAPPVTLSQLVLSPSTWQLAAGASKSFSVTGVWSDGATSPPPVTYSATGGTISTGGVYVAGAVSGTYRVIAKQTGGTLADTSVVTIQAGAATLNQLVLNPSAATVPVGATQSFVVSASWSDGSSTVPPVTFSATGGVVSASGVYTAGAIPGSYKLIATHTGGTKADTSVIIIPAAITLTQVVLTPSTVSLAPLGTKQFAVTGSWSDGSTLAPAVTYTATGGTITAGGLYAAGSNEGTFRVIAVQAGGSKADTSAVTITSVPTPPPGVLPITLPAAVVSWMGALTPASSTPTAWARYENDFAQYEATRWNLDQAGGGASGAGCKANTQFDYTNYYDRAYSLYQMWARTGNATYRTHADAIVICYRDGYLKPAGYGAQPHNWQMEGLAVHYWLTGDVASKDAIIQTVARTYPGFAAKNLTTESYIYWEGRIQARLLIGTMLAHQLGDASRNWGAVADSLATMSAALQHTDGSYAWPSFITSGQGNQANFMVGQLNYAFGQYYRIRNQNAQLLTTVKKSLDYLWSTQWQGTGFKYTNLASSGVASDLTGLLVYGWGFYASASGDTSYQTIGDQIFAAGITGAYLVQQKQFNQQYRETALYLGLRR